MSMDHPLRSRSRLSAAWARYWRDTWWRFLAFLLPALICVLLAGYLLIQRVTANLINPVIEHQQSVLARAEQTMSRHMGFIRRDLRLVGSRAALARLRPAGDEREVTEELRRFLAAAELYVEARVFLADGVELAHVVHGAGRPGWPPSENSAELARAFARLAFPNAVPGKLHIGGIEYMEPLGAQGERIPILRVATALTIEGRVSPGLLVLVVDARPMLSRMAEAVVGSRKEIQILDRSGRLLVTSPGAMRFGLDRKANGSSTDLPDELWQMISASTTTYGWAWNGAIWSHRRIALATALGDAPVTEILGRDEHWHLLVELPPVHVTWTPASVAQVGTALTALAALLVAWFGGRLILTESDRRQQGQLIRDQHDQLQRQHRELKVALDSLTQAKESLVKRETLAALGLTVAGVSHELNTPIGATTVTQSALSRKLDQLQELIDRGRLSRKDLDDCIRDAREALALIAASMKRASGVIGMLKTMVSERANQEISAVRLKDLVLSSVELHRLEKPDTEIELQVDIEESLVVRTRASALGQVISNLLSNASTHGFYRGDKGVITIRARVDQPADQLLIEIADNGVGMDEETQSKAFQPFFSTRRFSGGTGLGLSICHHLVTDVLAGEIQMRSAPGKGTRFVVALPLHPPGQT